MGFEVEAKILVIKETDQVSPKFKKREFIVEYAEDPLYPQLIKFELTQDRTKALDSYQVGGKVRVHFDLRGRKWTNREGVDVYFNTLQAWRLEPVSAEMGVNPPAGTPMGDTATDKIPF
jgi:hypothetical protein